MSFRDDHDAALARAAALQAELDRARSDDSRQESRIAQLEAQLAETEARRAAAEQELARHRPPLAPSTPSAPDHQLRNWIAGALILVSLGLLVVAIAASSDRKASDAEPPVPARPKSTHDKISSVVDELKARSGGGSLARLTLKGVRQDGSFDETTGALEATFAESDRCRLVRYTARGWEEGPLPVSYGPCLVGGMLESMKAHLYPHCSARTIWSFALRDGAPPGALADLQLEQLQWTFQVPGFARTYSDDCL